MRPRLSLALLLALSASLASAAGVLDLPAGRFEASDLSRLADPEVDDGIRVACFKGSIGAEERESLRAAGFEILGYVPENALLVRGAGAKSLADLDGLDFSHPYRPEWRRDPRLLGRGAEVLDLIVDLWPGEDAARAAGRAAAMGAQVLRVIEGGGQARIQLRAASSRIEDLSGLPGLRWMSEPGLREDRLASVKWITQSAIPDSTPVWDAGLHGEGQILGHMDSGFQLETCHFHDPDGNPVGPDHRKVVYVDPLHIFSSHGLHTASILASDIGPVYDWDTNRGMAYLARIATSKYNYAAFDLYQGLVLHHGYGARLHSNSWGDDSTRNYTQDCHDIDRFSYDYETDMVAFASTNGSILKSPENAKNVLAVGATENGEEPEIYEQHAYGGTGPTLDGRRKPEIYAPGRPVWAAGQAVTDDPSDWQNFCRGASKSGTSMACPAIVGNAALVRQYLTEGWYPSGAPVAEDAVLPSGALMRATMINAATDLAGVAGYPSDREGWGRLQVNLGLKLGEDSPIQLYLEDFRHNEGLDTGMERSYQFTVLDDSLDLKVTMAFSDYPGEVLSPQPVVNDLDLELVSPSGVGYLGNYFIDGFSSPGGEADPLNSIERVVLASPETGAWTLRVRGANVPMGPQGYAFIVSGQLEVDEGDLIPPSLQLALSLEGEALVFDIASDEALAAPARVTLEAPDFETEVLDAIAIGESGLLWQAKYVPGFAVSQLDITVCGHDAAMNEGCVEDSSGLYTLAASEDDYIQGNDGRLALDFPPGDLNGTELLSIRRVEEEPYLAVYEILPEIELAEIAILEWSYAGLDFPSRSGPEYLEILDGEGTPLDGYYDPDRETLVCPIEALTIFRVALGEAGSSSEVDADFAELGEAYPNPYRPLSHGTLRFALELRDSQRLRAEVFDASGRRVALLHDDWILPGHREIRWNGLTEEDEEPASGIYFLKVDVAGKVLTRKLVLLR